MRNNRHDILEMLRLGRITVDEAVWQLERDESRIMRPGGPVSGDCPGGKRGL